MKKSLHTSIKTTLCLFTLFLSVSFTPLAAQVLGDYQSVATGDWDAPSTWQVFTATGWVAATQIPQLSPTSNVTIKTGHSITFLSTLKNCRNLTVEAGASLLGNATIRFTGPTVRVDGTLGVTSGGVAFFLEPSTAPADGTTATITGTTTEISINRLRPNLTGLTVIIDANMYINPGQSTGGAAIGGNGKDGIVFTINAGKTVRTAPLGYLSCGASGSNDPTLIANWIVNIDGTLNVGTDVNGLAGTGIPPGTSATVPAPTYFNLRNGAGKTSTLNVGSTGVINIAGSLLAPTATAGTATVNVAAGGLINFVGYGASPVGTGQCDISKATTTVAGTIDFNNCGAGTRSIGTANVTGRLRMKDGGYPSGAVTLGGASVVEYYGGATLPATPITYQNLEINSSTASCTLGATATVTNAMTMTVGKLILGAFDMVLNGTLVGASGANKYFVTNSTGSLVRNNISASTIMQIGVSETSYDPFSVLPSGSGSFKARVGTTFTYPVADATRLVQREWTVVQTAGANPGAITLQYDATASVNSFNGALPTIIGFWNNTTWIETDCLYGGFFLPARTFGLTGATVVSGTFVAGNKGAVFPVELMSLTAVAKGNANIIAWQTASERNNAAFYIERSSNGTDFATIGHVKGAGTTATPQYYTFEDASPVVGVNYYRLKQVDVDNNTATSKVVSVNNDKRSGSFKFYPSVSETFLTVDYTTTDAATFNITDMLGRIVLTKTIAHNDGASSVILDVQGLSNGLYVVSVDTKGGRQVSKFEKR